jgi:hypothetical protein
MAIPFTPLVVGIALPLAYAAFRRWAPRDLAAEAVPDDGRRLPYGAAGACMWALGITLAVGGFFLLKGANHLWASHDHATALTIYPTSVIWCFLPAFAALSIPWLGTIWLLRRFGYAAQAAEIIANGNAKMNCNGERVMHWLGWGIVAPIAVFTLAAVPMHLSLYTDSIRVTHYAHLTPEVFSLADARRAYTVDGYSLRGGSFQTRPDLLIDFADGRRFKATVMSDGGDPPPEELVVELLAQTKLQPTHIRSIDDIPPAQKSLLTVYREKGPPAE